MDGEAQEEEEIELQQRDVNLNRDRLVTEPKEGVGHDTNLVSQIAALHLQISADVLVDCPRELVVEFPCHKCHQECAQSHNTRNDDQERLGLIPDVQLNLVHIVQGCHGFSNLLHLDRSVDQESDVTDTQSDDLNCILHSQRIVDQHQFVEETEAIEGKESGDCFGGGTVVG